MNYENTMDYLVVNAHITEYGEIVQKHIRTKSYKEAMAFYDQQTEGLTTCNYGTIRILSKGSLC